jgi:hypothetical protein
MAVQVVEILVLAAAVAAAGTAAVVEYGEAEAEAPRIWMQRSLP